MQSVRSLFVNTENDFWCYNTYLLPNITIPKGPVGETLRRMKVEGSPNHWNDNFGKGNLVSVLHCLGSIDSKIGVISDRRWRHVDTAVDNVGISAGPIGRRAVIAALNASGQEESRGDGKASAANQHHFTRVVKAFGWIFRMFWFRTNSN